MSFIQILPRLSLRLFLQVQRYSFFSCLSFCSLLIVTSVSSAQTNSSEPSLAEVEQKATADKEKSKSEDTKVKPPPPELPREAGYKQGEALYGFHAAIGFPQVIGYGIDYFSEDRTWGLALALGGFGIKREKSGSDPDFKFSYGGIHVTGRYHPFHGNFYTGLHAGVHSARIEATDTYSGQSITATARLRGNYAAPHLGFLWITNLGITVSTELGAQFNFGGKTDVDSGTTEAAVLNDPTYKKNKQDTEDQGNAVFNGVLPYLTLFRVGYSF